MNLLASLAFVVRWEYFHAAVMVRVVRDRPCPGRPEPLSMLTAILRRFVFGDQRWKSSQHADSRCRLEKPSAFSLRSFRDRADQGRSLCRTAPYF